MLFALFVIPLACSCGKQEAEEQSTAPRPLTVDPAPKVPPSPKPIAATKDVADFLSWATSGAADLAKGKCQEELDGFCIIGIPPSYEREVEWANGNPAAYRAASGAITLEGDGLITCEALGFEEARHWRSGQLEVRHCRKGGAGLQVQRMPGDPHRLWYFPNEFLTSKPPFAQHLKEDGFNL